MDKRLYKKIISISFTLSFLVFIVFTYISENQYKQSIINNGNLIKTYQIIRAANQSLISINEAALAVSTYLQNGDPERIRKLPQIIIAAQVNFSTLQQLEINNPTQAALIKQIDLLYKSKINFLMDIINDYKSGKISQAILLANNKKRLELTDEITNGIVQIKQIEIKNLDNITHNSNTTSEKSIKLILVLMYLFLYIIGLYALDKYYKK